MLKTLKTVFSKKIEARTLAEYYLLRKTRTSMSFVIIIFLGVLALIPLSFFVIHNPADGNIHLGFRCALPAGQP